MDNRYSAALKNKGRPLFIPFAVLGDPDQKRSVDVVRTLVESGADALELGFPFSDPPADGPVIQAADVRALAAGTTVDDCFAMLKQIRTFTDIPIGLLVYYNLVLQRGIGRFYADCASSGVDSVLIADLPLEHLQSSVGTQHGSTSSPQVAASLLTIAKSHGIAPVMLISELTTDERMKQIAAVAEGYLYVVSYLGVTGSDQKGLENAVRQTIYRARAVTDLPLLVGFGISTAEQVQATVKAGADGVIIGSRIVREEGNCERVAKVCCELRAGM